MERMKVVLGHLSSSQQPRVWAPSPCRASLSGPDDVVVVHGRRTPIAKSKRGGFKETTPDELLAAVMTAVLNDVKLSPEQLGDICVALAAAAAYLEGQPNLDNLSKFLSLYLGNVLQPGAGAMMARIGQFLSGIPETVPISCVNRQCSSGLQALINIAGGIRNGSYDIGLACGATNPGDLTSRILDFSKARDCLIPMGITSENVAERFGISRGKQDAFALASQQNFQTYTYYKGLTVDDIDVFEINEAFASQTFCLGSLALTCIVVSEAMAWCPCALGPGWEQLRYLNIQGSEQNFSLSVQPALRTWKMTSDLS
ncbi:hypothetical protein Chor_008403 [Crotalus horridus]